MKSKLKELIENKKVLVLGYGREGISTFALLREIGGYICLDVADLKEDIELPQNHNLISGANYEESLNNYDIVFKSAGIELKNDIKSYTCKITSQVDEFINIYHKQVIGITGTKGKSTVSSLLYHILKNSNKDVILAGNIGIPVFNMIEEINKDTIIILELSCHQLEYLKTSPHIAVFLNIYEDHLERYKTMERYFNAKANIYKHQKEEDKIYCGENVLNKIKTNAQIYLITKKDIGVNSLEDIQGVKIFGDNNFLNTCFVYNIVKNFKISDEEFYTNLKTFKGLPHRLEYFATINDVEYFDDSISTTVESTISAIESVKNIKTIIIGGMDRGINYDNLITYILKSNLDNVLCMYDSGKKIYDVLQKENTNINIKYFNTLQKTASYAKKICKPNTACVLSPAAASYGVFKNFEERGDIFQKLIKENN